MLHKYFCDFAQRLASFGRQGAMFDSHPLSELTEPTIIDCSSQLPRLRLVRQFPQQAYLWGQLPPGPWVSIVGTRRPTSVGQWAAFELGRQLATRGICVVSGGALGIDTAAHRGALAGNGATLVIAPTWLQVAYPTENRELFHEIILGKGGYLTVAERDQRPLNPAFFYRNEILAALSDAIVLGDCPFRSGARNAMFHARRMEKPRFCLPGVFGEPASLGNWMESHELGANAIVSVEPILRLLKAGNDDYNNETWTAVDVEPLQKKRALARQSARSPRQSVQAPCAGVVPPTLGRPTDRPSFPQGASEEMRIVANAVASGCWTPDAIAESSGMPVATVQHQILLLTLEGLVFQDDTGVLRYHAPDYE